MFGALSTYTSSCHSPLSPHVRPCVDLYPELDGDLNMRLSDDVSVTASDGGVLQPCSHPNIAELSFGIDRSP